MALLRARLVPASALGQQLLGLRACFLAPLLTRLGWILRWRPRTRPRVTPRLILKPPDPLLQPLHRRGQLQQSLHARLAPTVVDRLGLSPFHNRNIRPRDVGALLWNPELNGYGKARICGPFVSIGETGFEPATARPPAGAIQAYPLRFSALQPSELL